MNTQTAENEELTNGDTKSIIINLIRKWPFETFQTSTMTMVRNRLNNGWERVWRRGAIAALCAPVVFLTGCPQETGNIAAKPPANAQAPAVAPIAPTAPAQTASQAMNAATNAYKVQEIINKAEANYRSGVQNYQNNRLDAARLDFDDAVDTMLTSGLDIRADPQLSDEFDRLLSSVNSLEMAALKQGNGLSPKVEEAPLDTADEVTFPANPELVGKVAAELKTTQSDLPLVVNDYVAGFISYFSNSKAGHGHLVASLERAGKYRGMIEKSLRDAGLPQDLIYLAVAESGFQPQALNRQSGAGGMWQFMPFANSYGLVRNGWVDERFDPEKSTAAYARYIKELYNQFGDWYLAMAAYNWGPGNVQRAVQRTGYADFWTLYKLNSLPGATKQYVPGIIAAAIMTKNPQQYGLDHVTPMPAVVSDTVTVDYPVNLPLVADVTNSTLQEIVALNPSLLRLTTPPDFSLDLHLPVGTKNLFEGRMKQIPESKRVSWRFHEVKDGETLEAVASTMHSRAAEIAEANDIDPKDGVDDGDELVIPVAAAVSEHPQRYTVRKGDTLVTVADRFGVTVSDLRQWNHLSSSSVTPGKTLSIAPSVRLAPPTRVHKSRKGAKSSTGKTRSSSSTSKTSSAKRSSTSKSHAKAATAKPASKAKKK